MMEIYKKMDKWWIYNFEKPIAGGEVPAGYDADGVQNTMILLFGIMRKALWPDEPDKYTKMFEDSIKESRDKCQ